VHPSSEPNKGDRCRDTTLRCRNPPPDSQRQSFQRNNYIRQTETSNPTRLFATGFSFGVLWNSWCKPLSTSCSGHKGSEFIPSLPMSQALEVGSRLSFHKGEKDRWGRLYETSVSSCRRDFSSVDSHGETLLAEGWQQTTLL
jgi:hypothetical protein